MRSVAGAASLCLCLGIISSPAGAQPHPEQGERIRVELFPTMDLLSAQASPWEGTFVMFQASALVVSDDFGGARRLPFDDIDALFVKRGRGTGSSIVRGAAAGVVFGLGMWGFLHILCRSGCDGGFDSAWLPATISGSLVAAVVTWRSTSGGQWVQVSLPM